MSKVLFNLDDLALILVISSSLMFIAILLSDCHQKRHKIWLSAFLACVAVSSLNSILYWSPEIKIEIASSQPHVFLILKIALLAAAPILYIYTKSLIFNNFHLRKKDALHFSPAVLYIVALPIIYITLGADGIKASAYEYQTLYSNDTYWAFIWAMHLVKLGYGMGTYRLLEAHQERLQHHTSNTDGIDGYWLKLIVVGFLIFWAFGAFASLASQFDYVQVADATGLYGNYFLFALVNTLVIFSLTRHTKTAKRESKSSSDASQAHDYTDEQVNRLIKTLETREPFLNPDLTLEELSKTTSIPQRTLSSIINRHHNKNFFEFINEYRVERAAGLLLADDEKLSMLDIMTESGFNSKSAFNRFFKKAKGMTPTQFKSSNTAPETS